MGRGEEIPCGERVGRDLREREKLIAFNRTGVVLSHIRYTSLSLSPSPSSSAPSSSSFASSFASSSFHLTQPRDTHLIQLHEPLPQSIHLITINWLTKRLISKTQLSRQASLSVLGALSQFDPCTMFSSVCVLEPPTRLRASYSAASFADATVAVSRVCVCVCVRDGGVG